MKQLIENKVEELLSGQFCLSKACLRGNQTVFTVKADAKKPYLKILAYKNCVAVCSSEELSGRFRELLQGKSRDEIFELPFVYGQTIHYAPDHRGLPTGVDTYRCGLTHSGPYWTEVLFMMI